MFSESTLPRELDFLTGILGDRNDQYCEAAWRRGPFEEDVWLCTFGNARHVKIDFRVKLDDGNLLTAPEHHQLLKTFKSWLCVQTHFDATGGRTLGHQSQKQRVFRTLHLIDYFLLDAKRFELADHGLGLVTENDLRGMLLTLSRSRSIAHSIYQWPERLETFLRKQIASVSAAEMTAWIKKMPSLSEYLPVADDRLMNLSDEEIIRSRAWLWVTRNYVTGYEGFRYTPNTVKLVKILYANTLMGVSNKPVVEELQLEPTERYSREYVAAPVRNNLDDRNSEQTLTQYKGNLRCLGLLAEIRLPVPLSALRAVDSAAVGEALNLKITGRFRTLPQQVVFYTLRKAIEFALKFGDDIVDSYLSVARAAIQTNLGSLTYSYKHDIAGLLTPRIRELGVSEWTIDDNLFGRRDIYGRANRDEYFRRFRSNKGLWELLRVLYGAVQLCVGTLMARRSGELIDLVAGQCLDRSRSRLVFFNRKSGEAGTREREARPIPKVAVRLIEQLERLQDELVKIGQLKKKTNLFSYPHRVDNRLIALVPGRFNSSIEFFCDYFETPLNRDGQRYYIRQHQLRRFFAMLFFWGSSFGGMDTLRWFLGHIDIEHLYRYITESTPGEILRSIKANYVMEQVKAHNDAAESLAVLMEQHFGTRNFSVLDSDELEEYIEDLLNEGRVEIEPVFFETPEGKSYRILINVTQQGGFSENR